MTLLNKLIDEATDDFLVSSDWEKNLQICELINNNEDGTVFAKAIKKQLGSQSKRTRERALELLQTGMQNNYWVVRGVHSPEILNFFIDLIRSSSFDNSLKNQLLNLVRAWGEVYQDNSYGLPNFSSTYSFLRSKNYSFPAKSDDSNYSPPAIPQPKPVQPVSQPRPVANSFTVVQNRNPIAQPQVIRQPVYHQYPSPPPPGVYGQPVHYQRPPQPQPQPQTSPFAKYDAIKMTELISQQTFIQDILRTVDPSIENIRENETIRDLLNECRSHHTVLLQAVQVVNDEILLPSMLQFCDTFLDIEKTIDQLANQYQQRQREPQYQQPQQPRPSAFSPLSEELVLEIPLNSTNFNQPKNPNTFFSDFNPAPPPYQPQPQVQQSQQHPQAQPQRIPQPSIQDDPSQDPFYQLATQRTVPQINTVVPPPQYSHNPALLSSLQPSTPPTYSYPSNPHQPIQPPSYFQPQQQPLQQSVIQPSLQQSYLQQHQPIQSPAYFQPQQQPLQQSVIQPFQNYLIPSQPPVQQQNTFQSQPIAAPVVAQPAGVSFFMQPPLQQNSSTLPNPFPQQTQQQTQPSVAKKDPFDFLSLQNALPSPNQSSPGSQSQVKIAQPQLSSKDPFNVYQAQPTNPQAPLVGIPTTQTQPSSSSSQSTIQSTSSPVSASQYQQTDLFSLQNSTPPAAQNQAQPDLFNFLQSQPVPQNQQNQAPAAQNNNDIFALFNNPPAPSSAPQNNQQFGNFL